MNGLLPPRWSTHLQGLLRIVAAFLFIAHGTQKLFAFPVAEPSNPFPVFSLLGMAGVLEAG